MTMFEYLISGKEIRITDPAKKFDPAVFWAEDGRIKAWSPEIGETDHDDITPEKLEKHFDNMVREGLNVTVSAERSPFRDVRDMSISVYLPYGIEFAPTAMKAGFRIDVHFKYDTDEAVFTFDRDDYDNFDALYDEFRRTTLTRQRQVELITAYDEYKKIGFR